MKTKSSKIEIEEQIKKIFSSNPTQKQIKKAKKLAMSRNIKLKELRKKYCKKCYLLFNSNNSKIRIKNNIKIIKCKGCNYISRYKIS
jgi:RNase P subunit RPR2